jgi:hypothetical protein
MGGGSMIRKVGLERSTWADVPAKFEAGTPAVGDQIGLGVAVEYLTGLGMDAVRAHERELVEYTLARLPEVPDLTIHGPLDPDARGGVVAFTLGDIHPHDVAAILDGENVAVRAGHHCTQPLMAALSAWWPPPGPASTSTTCPRMSTASSKACTRRGRSSRYSCQPSAVSYQFWVAGIVVGFSLCRR